MTAQTIDQRTPLDALAGWWQGLRAWRYSGGKRDLRFDLLRGCAVCAMIADHVGGPSSIFYYLTGGDRFFVSAAEAFVFLSGLLMGVVNGGMLHRGDVAGALTKVLKRAGMLYSITIGLTLVGAVLPLLLGATWLSDPQDGSLLEYTVGVLTLHRTANLVDVMLLYTILVLAAEFVLLLLEYGYTRAVLVNSWGLWLVWQIYPSAADVWPIPGDELFAVSSWQVLFVTALVIGFHRRKLDAVFRAISGPQALIVSGAAMAGLIALHAADLAPLRALTGRDNATLNEWFFAKDDVAIGRIIACATLFVFTYALTTVCWRPLERRLGWLLLVLGQNALSAYVIHIFVMKGLELVHGKVPGALPSIVLSTAFQSLGIMIVWGAIRLRPMLAASLDRLESVQFLAPIAHTSEVPLLTQPAAVSLDVQLAQAEAGRGIDMLR